MWQVSWMPCTCAAVVEARAEDPLRGLGHILLRCKACSGQRTDTVCYQPPHDLRQPQRYP
jgi:hypothetical protein